MKQIENIYIDKQANKHKCERKNILCRHDMT